jgi:hypothetical protein
MGLGPDGASPEGRHPARGRPGGARGRHVHVPFVRHRPRVRAGSADPGRALRLGGRGLEPRGHPDGPPATGRGSAGRGDRHPAVPGEPRAVGPLRLPRGQPRGAVPSGPAPPPPARVPRPDPRRLLVGRDARLRRARPGSARDLPRGDQPRLLSRRVSPDAAVPRPWPRLTAEGEGHGAGPRSVPEDGRALDGPARGD